MNPKVTVIILNYNHVDNVINCLNSLSCQRFTDFEVILIDNGSKEEIYANLREELIKFKEKLDIRLIRNNKNLYFGAGNNVALKKVESEYICLLNYDTIAKENFIEEMVNFLEKNPDAGMITPKIKIYDNKDIIWNAGAYLDYRSAIVIGNRGYLEFDPKDKLYNEIEEIGFAPGTAMFVRKAVIEEAGLIDEIFLMYHEDPDWNLRAQEKGFKSYYVPTTTVFHDIPRIFETNKTMFKQYFFTRNSQILVWKHAKIIDILIFYYIFTIMNAAVILINLFSGNVNDFKVKLKSIWQGFRIGVKRRTNRSCAKYLLKDYKYSQKIQKF